MACPTVKRWSTGAPDDSKMRVFLRCQLRRLGRLSQGYQQRPSRHLSLGSHARQRCRRDEENVARQASHLPKEIVWLRRRRSSCGHRRRVYRHLKSDNTQHKVGRVKGIGNMLRPRCFHLVAELPRRALCQREHGKGRKKHRGAHGEAAGPARPGFNKQEESSTAKCSSAAKWHVA